MIDVMYLNLPRDVLKRAAMEQQFHNTHVRLHRIEPIRLETLRVPFRDQHTRAGSGGWKDHIRGVYTKQEISIVMSYKKALQHALDQNLTQPYIVLDDDVRANASQVARILSRDVREAPNDWEVLQFIVNNALARKQLCTISEPFVPWFPEFYSSAFTLVRSREIAEAIVWTPPFGHMVLDHWLFVTFKSFTHTRNLFESIHWEGAVNGDELSYFAHCETHDFATTRTRNTSIAAVTATNHTSGTFKFGRLPQNVHVYVITKRNYLVENQSTIEYLPWIHTSKSKWFSKWTLFDRFVRSRAAMYEFVMFFDDDMQLSGFPWSTLVKESFATPTNIVGIPRESEFSNTVYKIPEYEKSVSRDYFVVSNGDFWREMGSNHNHRWSKWQTTPLNPNNVQFIEQGLTLFRTDFLRWYFKQVEPLIRRMHTSRSDWGIDVMWCAAASEYSRIYKFANRTSCRMFGFPVWHYDTGSLTKHYDWEQSKAFRASGFQQLKFLKSVPRYRAWMDDAKRGMIGKV